MTEQRWPRVYVYSLPDSLVRRAQQLQPPHHDWFAMHVGATGHVTQNGEEADYFLVPGVFAPSQVLITQVLEHVSQAHPFWNTSERAGGQPRHILSILSDQGLSVKCRAAPCNQVGKPGSGHVPFLLTSPLRRFIALVFNGNPRLGFVPGKDIVITHRYTTKHTRLTATYGPIVRNLLRSPWRPTRGLHMAARLQSVRELAATSAPEPTAKTSNDKRVGSVGSCSVTHMAAM